MDRKMEYPRIIQIMPAHNIWIRYEDIQNPGQSFYSKATCLALIEERDERGKIDTYLEYIDMDSHGFYDLSVDRSLSQDERIVYSEIDLSCKTNE